MDKVEYYNKEVRDCVGSTTKVTTNQPTLINLLRALESSYAEVISSFASPIFLTANSYDNSYDETGEDLEDGGLLKEENKEKRAYYEKALGKSFCNWWANPGNVNEEEGGDKTKTFWIRLESRDMPPCSSSKTFSRILTVGVSLLAFAANGLGVMVLVGGGRMGIVLRPNLSLNGYLRMFIIIIKP